MKAVIFGASGMVGGELLDLLLADNRFKKIVSVGRSTLEIESTKLQQIVHKNYKDYSQLRDCLSNADICFYCLGVYQTQVSKQEFWVITVGFLSALIDELVDVNNSIKFCLFSAQGASPDEKSLFLFGNAKGRAERKLMESSIETQYIFRPGFINPGKKSAMSGFSLIFFVCLYKMFPSIGIDAPELAKVMLDRVLNGGSKVIYGNKEMRRLTSKT